MQWINWNVGDVTCTNCGTVYGVGFSDVPHSVDKIHRIFDTCMMPIEVKNPWNDKAKISLRAKQDEKYTQPVLVAVSLI